MCRVPGEKTDSLRLAHRETRLARVDSCLLTGLHAPGRIGIESAMASFFFFYQVAEQTMKRETARQTKNKISAVQLESESYGEKGAMGHLLKEVWSLGRGISKTQENSRCNVSDTPPFKSQSRHYLADDLEGDGGGKKKRADADVSVF